MLVDEYQYSNLGGYGIFCGKKCVAEKQAQGIPPKRGKKNIALWEAQQSQRTMMQNQQQGGGAGGAGGGSRTGLIVGGVLLLAIAGVAIYVIKKRKEAA